MDLKGKRQTCANWELMGLLSLFPQKALFQFHWWGYDGPRGKLPAIPLKWAKSTLESQPPNSTSLVYLTANIWINLGDSVAATVWGVKGHAEHVGLSTWWVLTAVFVLFNPLICCVVDKMLHVDHCMIICPERTHAAVKYLPQKVNKHLNEVLAFSGKVYDGDISS